MNIRKEIYKLVKKKPGLSSTDICEKLGMEFDKIRNTLVFMRRYGNLRNETIQEGKVERALWYIDGPFSDDVILNIINRLGCAKIKEIAKQAKVSTRLVSEVLDSLDTPKFYMKKSLYYSVDGTQAPIKEVTYKALEEFYDVNSIKFFLSQPYKLKVKYFK